MSRKALARGGLTPKREAFVREYVAAGGSNATQAAIRAGFSPTCAQVKSYQLLRDPAVLDAIQQLVTKRMRAGTAIGMSVLEHLANNATSESVRLQAAQALLDRGGMKPIQQTEHRHIVEHRAMSDAELEAAIVQKVRQLGLAGRVVDASAKVIEDAVIVPNESDRVVAEGCDSGNESDGDA